MSRGFRACHRAGTNCCNFYFRGNWRGLPKWAFWTVLKLRHRRHTRGFQEQKFSSSSFHFPTSRLLNDEHWKKRFFGSSSTGRYPYCFCVVSLFCAQGSFRFFFYFYCVQILRTQTRAEWCGCNGKETLAFHLLNCTTLQQSDFVTGRAYICQPDKSIALFLVASSWIHLIYLRCIWW